MIFEVHIYIIRDLKKLFQKFILPIFFFRSTATDGFYDVPKLSEVSIFRTQKVQILFSSYFLINKRDAIDGVSKLVGRFQIHLINLVTR